MTDPVAELRADVGKALGAASMPTRLIVGAVAAVAGFLLVIFVLSRLGFHFDPLNLTKKRADAAEAQATAAGQTAALATNTVQIFDHYTTETKIIHDQASKEAQSLQTLPGATNEIAPDRRAALCSMLGRMRNDPSVCSDDPGPSDSTSALR